MDIDTVRIQSIFNYLSVQDAIERAEGAFAFGRADALVALSASKVYKKGLVKYILFTGGLGKDSGFLSELNIAEADFLAACANIIYRVPEKDIHRETQASNAGENASFGLKLLSSHRLPMDSLIVIAHATSLRRLAATLEQNIFDMNLTIKLIKQATPYVFDPSSRADQLEACSELVKLEDYAKKGWCCPQADLPHELVAYAKEVLRSAKNA